MILSSRCCVQFYFSTVHYDALVTRASRCELARDLLKYFQFLTLAAVASVDYGRTLLNLYSSSLEVSVAVDKTVHLCTISSLDRIRHGKAHASGQCDCTAGSSCELWT